MSNKPDYVGKGTKEDPFDEVCMKCGSKAHKTKDHKHKGKAKKEALGKAKK